jgi:hypothetical protein
MKFFSKLFGGSIAKRITREYPADYDKDGACKANSEGIVEWIRENMQYKDGRPVIARGIIVDDDQGREKIPMGHKIVEVIEEKGQSRYIDMNQFGLFTVKKRFLRQYGKRLD